jgi:hypothetical protein
MPDRDHLRGDPRRLYARPERRPFDGRTAALYDQDRAGYGRDAGAAGYSHPHTREEDLQRYGPPRDGYDDEPQMYGGQEYGLEGQGRQGDDRTGAREFGFERGGADRRAGFDRDDPGVGQSRAGYGFKTRAEPGQDFDPDYLRWREAQLRRHDRAFEDWRREQRDRYDAEYRRFCADRRRRPGQSFEAWRADRREDR